MKAVELEYTYLAKKLPDGLADCPSKKVIDVYFPISAAHPNLRVRQAGETCEITKKLMANGSDSSNMIEHTISLTPEEFAALTSQGGKRVAKTRYYYPYEGRIAEVDVFVEALAGLVLVDFEFASREEQLAFRMPDFCLADVTQEAFTAGGMVAGKTYHDLEARLATYHYQTLSF